MLLKQKFLDGIAAGKVRLAFRRWRRPTVKAGGTLRTAIGVLAIKSVEPVDEDQITAREAKQAGYGSREELLEELNRRKEGQLFRISLAYAGDDPRLALRRKNKLSKQELADVNEKLARMDSFGSRGAWTTATLKLIAAHPGQRAAELAERLNMETKRFKTNVRKLKELGLTESLGTGYRISPRGRVVCRQLGIRC